MFRTGLYAATPLAAVIGLPRLPPISSDPDVIAVVNVARCAILIVAMAIMAISAYQLRMMPTSGWESQMMPGWRARVWALMFGCAYVGFSTYERITEPVTIQFILATAFIIMAWRGVRITVVQPRPMSTAEERLLGFRRPSDDETP